MLLDAGKIVMMALILLFMTLYSAICDMIHICVRVFIFKTLH